MRSLESFLPNGTKIYAINDSGNEAELLIYDTFSGDIQRVVIAQAKNVDWEELAQDDSGNVFYRGCRK
jgi:hypothetical protein